MHYPTAKRRMILSPDKDVHCGQLHHLRLRLRLRLLDVSCHSDIAVHGSHSIFCRDPGQLSVCCHSAGSHRCRSSKSSLLLWASPLKAYLLTLVGSLTSSYTMSSPHRSRCGISSLECLMKSLCKQCETCKLTVKLNMEVNRLQTCMT